MNIAAMKPSIAALAEGMSFQGLPALIVEKKVAATKNGKSYADLTVRDKSGSLKCKIWNYNVDPDYLVEGKVILIGGDVSSYQGDLQAVLNSYAPSELPPQDFAKSSRFKTEEMWEDVLKIVADIKEPMTSHVIRTLLNKHTIGFQRAPAARDIHNAWYGGLLEHVWNMCGMAPAIIDRYTTHYKSPLSKDKVMFGLILHDVGKIVEYDWSNPSFKYRPEGLMTNHLVLGPSIVYEECNAYWRSGPSMTLEEFTRERAHLMHVLAAHHGTLEWGSPVQPVTLEAILVHQIDLIDSRVMHALELTEGKAGQIAGFSEKSWATKTSYMKYNTEA